MKMKNIISKITATGAYLPKNIITNNDIAKLTDTSDEWIHKRTGIEKRHFVSEGETCADIAVLAAQDAIKKSGLRIQDIDAIIVATTTPDQTFPATASKVHRILGCKPCPFFDIQAVCSGFIYALQMADNMIKLAQANHVLVIGAEVYSKIIASHERDTFVLFGDGAGAVILSADNADLGILKINIMADGKYQDMLYVDGGVATTGLSGIVRMNGKEVFRHAVEKMSDIVAQTAQELGLDLAQIDWLVPHQANWRIMLGVAQKLNIAEEKVIKTVHLHANISAATIPFALNYGFENRMIKPRQLVALTALGGGFAWGGAILRI